MPTHPSVVVVGSFVQDLTWKCRAFPRPGETTVGTFKTGPGGKGSNQAVASGRAGVDTLFVGAAGDDAFASQAREFYRAEKIGCQLALKPSHATGTAAILVNENGQNEIIVALGANDHLKKSDVPAKALQQARVVVSQLESNLDTAAYVLKIARKAGVTTVLNPAPMRPDFPATLLNHTDILIPNETEFAALMNLLPQTGCSGFTEDTLKATTETQLHALCQSLGVPTVIVTLGARGCFVSREDGFVFIPAYTGIKVVDTTGAGDAFVGGFAAGLVKFEGDLVAAARFGNAVAALSVTKFGTAPAMPRASEIARFLKTRR
ncbi:MAG: ribokinase [Nibricoccus sp.]